MTDVKHYPLLLLLLGISLLLSNSSGRDSKPTKNGVRDEDGKQWKRSDVVDRMRRTKEEEIYRRGVESGDSQAVHKWVVDPNANDTLDQLIDSNWTVEKGDNYSNLSVNPYILESLDYRTWGYVTSVDNQRACDAPWAFVVAGAVEALRARKTGTLQKLSRQQLLDCTGPKNYCGQGTVTNAMTYAKQHGLINDCAYGYEAEKKVCRYDRNNVVFEIKNYITFPTLNEKQLKYNIATLGPGITHLYVAPSLRDYKGGIFSMRNCNPAKLPLHPVLIIGYSTSKEGKDYWIIKNNVGVGWGEQGYLRLERNVNFCGIGTFNYWPGDWNSRT